uniref:Uncharacterized protein n=1 Tax=Panagrolaimus sp. ES5 TaxID=591445 RepID=A0AC34FJA7_9BILA
MSAPDFILHRNNGKSYYAMVTHDEYSMRLFVYDEEDPKNGEQIALIGDEALIDQLPILVDRRFKGVIVQLFEYKPENYTSNYAFCCKIRKCLDGLKVPYFFTARTEKNTSTALIGANITSKIGDIILSVLVGRMNYIVAEYKFTENGYIMVTNRGFPYFPESEGATKTKIMGACNPSVILGFTPFDSCSTTRLASVMRSEKKFIMVDFKQHGYKYPGEMVKWLLDNSYTKFFVQPISWKNTGVIGVMGQAPRDLFEIHCDTQLPAEAKFTVSKCFSHIRVLSITENNKVQQDLVTQIELPKNCHKTEITLSMDINQFVTVTTKEIAIPEIEALPKKLDESLESKIPVIGFFDQSSVVCVAKDDENYKFLEQWGGVYGDELFINFDTEPAKYGVKAVIPFKTAMNSVVFGMFLYDIFMYITNNFFSDLIKILSMPITNIKKDPKWRFKFTKDSNNPCLIEVVKHDGTTATQSPTFFMALLLKEQILKMKEELGEKPKEIGFCFFDTFNFAERKRIETKLQEACGFLKTKCIFVEV